MRYYVVSDVHGFYTQLESALEKAGFFNEVNPCKLVICGDLLDRGGEAKQMQDFALKLLRENRLIFIKGNHEDLFLELLEEIECYSGDVIEKISMHHILNGTWDTFLQLSDMGQSSFFDKDKILLRIKNSTFFKYLLPVAMNFFETEHFVFVHGWFPYDYSAGKEWREADEEAWRKARWYNGMELACEKKIILKNKIVISGHIGASWGHSNLKNKRSKKSYQTKNTPFSAKGILSIDGSTSKSGIVNCIVIED